jgi:hypothetical protein
LICIAESILVHESGVLGCHYFVVDEITVLGGIVVRVVPFVNKGCVPDVSTFLFVVGGVGIDLLLGLLIGLSLLGMVRKEIYDAL